MSFPDLYIPYDELKKRGCRQVLVDLAQLDADQLFGVQCWFPDATHRTGRDQMAFWFYVWKSEWEPNLPIRRRALIAARFLNLFRTHDALLAPEKRYGDPVEEDV